MSLNTRLRLWACLMLAVVTCGPWREARLGAVEKSIPGVSVATKYPRHPVLLRNVHGPLIRITLHVAAQQPITLKSIAFRLEGTDLERDVLNLALYTTGDKDDFVAPQELGKPVAPAAAITINYEQPLSAGKHVLWLSCRLNDGAVLSHDVAATWTAIETTAGTITPATVQPAVRHRIGVAVRKHQDDGVHTYRIPALALSSKGTLLCVYDMRRRASRDLQEDIDIGLSRSRDGGQTWEPAQVIMDMGEFGGLPQEQNGCSDPGIIVDQQTGEIFCFAVWMNGKPGKHQWRDDGSEPGYEIGKTAQLLVVRSTDDGKTWTKPENLTRALKPEAWWLLAPSPQQGINLPDGTLVMPIQGRDVQGVPFSTIMISRDHGANWIVGQPAYSGGSECQAVQLGDGSIMLNIRNDHDKFRAVYVTTDLGKTWQPHPTNRHTLIEPTCNASLFRADYDADGKRQHVLLFANPHTQKTRTQQTIQVSFDDGLTWPKAYHLLLDEGRGAGYPSFSRVDDQHIGLIYEGSQAQLVFEKFSIAELIKK